MDHGVCHVVSLGSSSSPEPGARCTKIMFPSASVVHPFDGLWQHDLSTSNLHLRLRLAVPTGLPSLPPVLTSVGANAFCCHKANGSIRMARRLMALQKRQPAARHNEADTHLAQPALCADTHNITFSQVRIAVQGSKSKEQTTIDTSIHLLRCRWTNDGNWNCCRVSGGVTIPSRCSQLYSCSFPPRASRFLERLLPFLFDRSCSTH